MLKLHIIVFPVTPPCYFGLPKLVLSGHCHQLSFLCAGMRKCLLAELHTGCVLPSLAVRMSSQKCPGHWVDLKQFVLWHGLLKGSGEAEQGGRGFEEFPYLIGSSLGSRRFILSVWKPTKDTPWFCCDSADKGWRWWSLSTDH